MLNSTVEAMIAYVALLAVLVVYALLISIDIGAGFYYWLAGLRPRGAPAGAVGIAADADDAASQAIRRVTQAYLSPVWEVTNVFFILFVVGMIGFFPASARIFGTALLVPISLATIALIVRGAALAFHHAAEGTARWFARALTPVFGLTGLLVPALLVTFLSSAENGAIQVHGGAQGPVIVSQTLLWLSPLQLTLAALAVVVALYLGAVALASFAAHRGELAVARFYRRAALWSGGAVGALALAFGVALDVVAPFHAAALLAQWPALLVTLALFGVSLWALAIAPTHEATGRGHAARPYGLAAWAALTQVALALAVFMLTRAPYLLYPTVRLADVVTPPATFTALSLTVVIGLVFVIPSLGLLYALFLRAPATTRRQAQAQPAAPAFVAISTPAASVSATSIPAPAVPTSAMRHATQRATHSASHTRRMSVASGAGRPLTPHEHQVGHEQTARRQESAPVG